MTQSDKPTNSPTESDPLEVEHRFLNWLLLGILVVTAISWIYNGYSRLVIETNAKEAITQASTGDSIDRQSALDAFELLRSPHFFANYTEARGILPAHIPDGEACGQMEPSACLCEALPECCRTGAAPTQRCTIATMLVGQTEENLLENTDNIHIRALLDGIEYEGKKYADIQSLLIGPGNNTEKESVRTALPAFASYIRLKKNKFQFTQMTKSIALSCRSYAPCLADFLKRRQPVIHNYLELRRSNRMGNPLNEEITTFFRPHASLFLLAFRQDKVEGDAPVTRSDLALFETLLEIRGHASDNGLLFSVHLTLVCMILGVFRLVSPRFLPKRVS